MKFLVWIKMPLIDILKKHLESCHWSGIRIKILTIKRDPKRFLVRLLLLMGYSVTPRKRRCLIIMVLMLWMVPVLVVAQVGMECIICICQMIYFSSSSAMAIPLLILNLCLAVVCLEVVANEFTLNSGVVDVSVSASSSTSSNDTEWGLTMTGMFDSCTATARADREEAPRANECRPRRDQGRGSNRSRCWIYRCNQLATLPGIVLK